MILFLNNLKPVNVETLEKEIWQHSSELETIQLKRIFIDLEKIKGRVWK